MVYIYGGRGLMGRLDGRLEYFGAEEVERQRRREDDHGTVPERFARGVRIGC